MSTLKLIGSMDGRDYYQPADVLNLLATDPQSLISSTAFSGRPQTRIHTDFKDVVKIRAELELGADKAFPWAEAVLKQERLLAVHHPRKTWFVSQTQDTGKILIGNISPYLEPLHMVFKQPPVNKQQRRQYLTLLTSMFEKYLRLGKNLGYKLDEGLSNFAVDEVGEVFYLDDEYYKWDNFVAFAIMLGVFIRGYDWLDGFFIRGLSRQLHCLIDEIFVDPHCRTIVASQMQTLFMPSLHKEQLLKKFRAGLSTRPVAGAMHLANKKRLNARKNNKNRFYAVLGDIHGNDAALIRVLDFYRERNITQGIVLGDIVGYGPEPKRCIELLEATGFEIIKGNHDHAVATGNTEIGFSGSGKLSIDWTSEQLCQKDKDWLLNLPAYSHHQHWLAVHGAPIDPAFFYGYVRPLTAEENLDHLQRNNIALCLHGHSHLPGVFARDTRLLDRHNTDSAINIRQYTHVLACPGSVGQPRNGVPGAQCAIYDREDAVLEFFNLGYPVDKVVEKMKRQGLPEGLWRRLLIGR